MKDIAAAEEEVAGVSASGNVRIPEQRKRGIVRLVGGWVVGALSEGRVVGQDVVLLCFRQNSL